MNAFEPLSGWVVNRRAVELIGIVFRYSPLYAVRDALVTPSSSVFKSSSQLIIAAQLGAIGVPSELRFRILYLTIEDCLTRNQTDDKLPLGMVSLRATMITNTNAGLRMKTIDVPIPVEFVAALKKADPTEQFLPPQQDARSSREGKDGQ